MQHAPRASRQARRRGRPPAEPADGLLPAAPRDPALHLALPLDDRDRRRRGDQLDRDARRRPAAGGLHRFMCSYIRYSRTSTRTSAWWPTRIPASSGRRASTRSTSAARPAAQPRWKTFFRIFLAVPALLLSTALGGGATFRFRRGEAEDVQGTAWRRARSAAARRSARLVREHGPRADAEGPARRGCVRRRLHRRRCSPTCCSSPTAIRTPTRRRCSPASSGRRSIRCTSSATRTTCASRASPSSSGCRSRSRTSSGSRSGRWWRSSPRSPTGSRRSSPARRRRACTASSRATCATRCT